MGILVQPVKTYDNTVVSSSVTLSSAGMSQDWSLAGKGHDEPTVRAAGLSLDCGKDRTPSKTEQIKIIGNSRAMR